MSTAIATVKTVDYPALAADSRQAKIIAVSPMVPIQASQRVAGRVMLSFMSGGRMAARLGPKAPKVCHL
jgi:hypothetical protein